MPSAEIIAIGTELLLGETTDTNTRFIARTLRNLGVDLFRSHVIGDNASRIAESVRQALDRAEIVITTGGLGPTVDDPTRQAIAEALDQPLEFRPELWEQIQARIARYGRSPTENQKRQAYVPSGSLVINNPVGTAPAFILKVPSPLKVDKTHRAMEKVVICLPGVPKEMETLLLDSVVPFLQQQFSLHDLIFVRTLHVSGLGEGMIDDLIGDLEILSNPTVGLTAHSGIVDIRMATKAGNEIEARRQVEKVEMDLRSRLGESIFGADEDTLEGVVLEAIAEQYLTLAVYEIGLGSALIDRLSRSKSTAYKGGSNFDEMHLDLSNGIPYVLEKFQAIIAMGVCLEKNQDQFDIRVVIRTNGSEEVRALQYGGHPGNAQRWAVNIALDTLRQWLVKLKSNKGIQPD